MAAHLENRDIQAGIEQAWHGMTKVVPAVTFEDAFPFDIEREQLHTADHGPLEGWSYFRCTDDNQPAGKPVPDSYQALTNARFWEIVQNAIGGTDATVESAGTIFDRCRRFVTVKLGTDVDDFVVGERTFKNRFSLLDSIDQSTNFYGVNSSTCVVCANTFQLVMGDNSGEFRFKIRHSKNLLPKIENMEKAIDSFVGVTAQFQAALKVAESVPVNETKARQLFAGWMSDDEAGISTRSYNVVSRLTDLYKGGAGNRGETLLDVFSAVTDYYSHESSGGEDQPGFRLKQTVSSEWGSGQRKKADFFNTLFTFDRKTRAANFAVDDFDTLVERGNRLLQIADAELVAN